MIEALRVLKVCRKTAVAARRIAPMIQMNIVSARMSYVTRYVTSRGCS
jgi:hypothetical protein